MSAPAARGSMKAADHLAAMHDPQASPEEILESLKWLESDEANAAAAQGIEHFVQSCERVRDALPDWEIHQALAGDPDDRGYRPFLPPVYRPVYRVAAAFAVVAVGIGLILLAMGGIFTQEASNRVAMRYATTTGESRTVSLPDGSTVALGGASAVVVRFSPEGRHVNLTDGEAFFTVAHDTHRPFIVAAGGGTVRALGTMFNVQRTARGISVAVAEGRIRVRSTSDAVDMITGMQLSYASDGRMSPIVLVDAADIASWRQGVLRYHNESLGQVIADLNRYSSRPIVLESRELAQEQITGTVRVDRIEDWLSGLAATGPITMRDGPNAAILLTHASAPQPR